MNTIEEAWLLSKVWRRAAVIWRIIDHLIVIGAFSSSVLVVYISSSNIQAQNEKRIIALSSIFAMLTLMGFAFNPTKYMRSYRLAFQTLNEVLIVDTDNEGNSLNSLERRRKIEEAINQREYYIGKTYDIKELKCNCWNGENNEK